MSKITDVITTAALSALKSAGLDHLPGAGRLVQAFLFANSEALVFYCRDYARGDLSADSFRQLLRGRLEVLKMEAWEGLGIAQDVLETFREGLLKALFETLSVVGDQANAPTNQPSP